MFIKLKNLNCSNVRSQYPFTKTLNIKWCIQFCGFFYKDWHSDNNISCSNFFCNSHFSTASRNCNLINFQSMRCHEKQKRKPRPQLLPTTIDYLPNSDVVQNTYLGTTTFFFIEQKSHDFMFSVNQNPMNGMVKIQFAQTNEAYIWQLTTSQKIKEPVHLKWMQEQK